MKSLLLILASLLTACSPVNSPDDFVEITSERRNVVLHKNTPELFQNNILQQNSYTPASLAKAANYYISLGETRAVKKLTALQTRPFDEVEGSSAYSLEVSICWICKMVFEPKTKPLRPPGLGSLSLPYETMPLEKWPNFPLAEEDGVYFVLDCGYFLAGIPERSSDYLKYCQTNGKFRTLPVVVPTRSRAERAAEKLFKSKRWSEIQWPLSSEASMKSELLKQATTI